MGIEFVVTGNLTIDDVVTADGAISPSQCGGNGVYAAVGAWIWSDSVGLVAGAGADYPTGWLDRIAAAGIDTAGVYRLPETHALRSRVFYRADGSRTDRVAEATLPPEVAALIDLSQDFSAMGSEVHREAWPRYSPAPPQLPASYRRARGAHLAPGPHANLRALAAQLRAADDQTVLTLDWPWWDETGQEFDDELLGLVTAVLPGREELAAWPLRGDAAATLAGLVRRCPVVVVKEGADGCSVHTAPAVRRIGVVPVEPGDPTGAGDAFCGGFLVGLARTGDPVLAAAHGAVSASFVVETFGALSVLEVDRALAEHRLKSLISTLDGGIPS
ncbi:carbohydrate kinase family protein [Micromonospora sp. WMMD882]|uniref:carbohydrate kinase family protein n=1 Tax=Micromonospora sp. WMMD882 TaxID=3015151 RepID=UPI00248C5319|nr:carbohydrate kinase family protein [Micromonospora sp. WMMD882]WBB78464.1 carbohydrate kinase family protein [Micromonospora sp. WMMD882]